MTTPAELTPSMEQLCSRHYRAKDEAEMYARLCVRATLERDDHAALAWAQRADANFTLAAELQQQKHDLHRGRRRHRAPVVVTKLYARDLDNDEIPGARPLLEDVVDVRHPSGNGERSAVVGDDSGRAGGNESKVSVDRAPEAALVDAVHEGAHSAGVGVEVAGAGDVEAEHLAGRDEADGEARHGESPSPCVVEDLTAADGGSSGGGPRYSRPAPTVESRADRLARFAAHIREIERLVAAADRELDGDIDLAILFNNALVDIRDGVADADRYAEIAQRLLQTPLASAATPPAAAAEGTAASHPAGGG